MMVNLLRRSQRPRLPTLLHGHGPRLRVGTWPNDAEVGHLIVLEPEHVPSPTELARIVDQARARGLRSIRTGALFPDAAAALLDAGFTRIDTLTLLQLELDDRFAPDRTGSGVAGHGPSSHPRVQRLRVGQDGAAAEIDRLAFGPLWGYDRHTVTEVRRATPAHRARRIGGRRQLEAYAISGAGDRTGYLQRLAVRPDRRRCGLASALVTDSLHWMRSRGLGSALVNTASGNRAALMLYRRFGFRPMADQLTLAELVLGEGRSPTVRCGDDPTEPWGRPG